MIIHIEEEEDHNSEYHIDVYCEHCKKKFSKTEILYHQENCLDRKSECRYCFLQVSMKDKDEHEYICGAKTEKCDKCNKFITIKDFDIHHCEEEIYLNKHIDINNIPVVNKKPKKIINTGDIVNMNKIGILHGKNQPVIMPVNAPIVQPPIVHHKRDVIVNKGPTVKVEVGNILKEKNNRIETNHNKKPNISDKINSDTYDKYKKDKIEKIEIQKELGKKEINSTNKVDDILKAGLKHKEKIPKPTIKPKPFTPNKSIHKTTDLNKKLTSSPDKLPKEPVVKKMPYKKEIPKYASNNKQIIKDRYNCLT
jgi:hypothetical protein